MIYNPPLEKVRFLRRFKRFLVDVERDNGEIFTVHCPNTGRMTNCLVRGSDCWILNSENPKRKYRYSLELVTTSTGHIACVNTQRANELVHEAINISSMSDLNTYDTVLREQRYGKENSRIDFLLMRSEECCYVEVKSVTLGFEHGVMKFPDAVSVRGQKHLRELIMMCEEGHRAVLLFCALHSDAKVVSPADEVDPEYASLLRKASTRGVEVLAYGARINSKEIYLLDVLKVCL